MLRGTTESLVADGASVGFLIYLKEEPYPLGEVSEIFVVHMETSIATSASVCPTYEWLSGSWRPLHVIQVHSGGSCRKKTLATRGQKMEDNEIER